MAFQAFLEAEVEELTVSHDLEVERLQERLGQLQTVQDKLELQLSEKRKEHEKALLDMDTFEEQNQEEEETGGGGGGGGGKGRSEDDLDNGPSFLGFGLSTPPGGRPGLKTSGVLARFQSASDGVSVYVAYTIGAQFKPTLLQVRPRSDPEVRTQTLPDPYPLHLL